MTLRQHHASLNQETRSLRDAYASHRNQIMRLIGIAKNASCTDVTRVAVLGAGNGNDIDVASLTQQFDEVHFVDLDGEAIDFACTQSDVIQKRIHRHCPVDIASPLLEIAEPILQCDVSDRATCINPEWIKRLQQPPPLPIPPCDIVVSVGLLSQLMLSIDRAFAHLSPQTVLPLIQTVRCEHFRRVASMLRPASDDHPGGVAVFGFDFVSSDSAPQLLNTPDDNLEPLAVKLINNRNFFTGMNPGVLMNELDANPVLHTIHIESPWRWKVGSRQYLMMAVLLQSVESEIAQGRRP